MRAAEQFWGAHVGIYGQLADPATPMTLGRMVVLSRLVVMFLELWAANNHGHRPQLTFQDAKP